MMKLRGKKEGESRTKNNPCSRKVKKKKRKKIKRQRQP